MKKTIKNGLIVLLTAALGTTASVGCGGSVSETDYDEHNPLVTIGTRTYFRAANGEINPIGFDHVYVEDNGGFTGPTNYVGYKRGRCSHDPGRHYHISLEGKAINASGAEYDPFAAAFNAAEPYEHVNITK